MRSEALAELRLVERLRRELAGLDLDEARRRPERRRSELSDGRNRIILRRRRLLAEHLAVVVPDDGVNRAPAMSRAPVAPIVQADRAAIRRVVEEHRLRPMAVPFVVTAVGGGAIKDDARRALHAVRYEIMADAFGIY